MREEKYICEECGLICKFRSDLEDHIQKEHKKYQKDIKNKKECILWNRGFCKKGSYCTFKHINHENINDNIIYSKFKDNCKFSEITHVDINILKTVGIIIIVQTKTVNFNISFNGRIFKTTDTNK